MCFVSEGVGNVGFKRCPRTLLGSAISSAPDLDIKIGFEVEFRCLNTDGTDLEDCLEGWSTKLFALRNRCVPIIEQIVQIVQMSGIEVRQFHAEGPQGMFEISADPMPPLQAIDAWVYTRETIKESFCKTQHNCDIAPLPHTAASRRRSPRSYFYLPTDRGNGRYFSCWYTLPPPCTLCLLTSSRRELQTRKRFRVRVWRLRCMGDREPRCSYPKDPKRTLGDSMLRWSCQYVFDAGRIHRLRN